MEVYGPVGAGLGSAFDDGGMLREVYPQMSSVCDRNRVVVRKSPEEHWQYSSSFVGFWYGVHSTGCGDLDGPSDDEDLDALEPAVLLGNVADALE